jgi:quercetin dioxygenase-like cupin family protein
MSEGPRVVWMPGGVRTEIHLTGAQTEGAFCLLADEPPPGWSLPPHRHRAEAETIHIVAGTFTMEVDGVVSTCGPGDTVHVPAGVRHSGANVGGEPGRRILVFSPAGMEGFFLQAGAAAAADARGGRETLGLALRFGWEFDEAGTAP